MEKDSVYLETSLVSYLTARPSRDIVAAAHQTITLDWWDNYRQHFELFISQVVVDEAKLGNSEAAAKRLNILEGITHLDISEEVDNFSRTLISDEIIPQQSLEDALHVAVSCVNGMNYLLTWNCKHIANAKKRAEIERLCAEFGYFYPIICTPEELLLGE
ncbi:MAG: type II toxin-antitoxin system VapC family toxin [Pseudomonadota bacterium]